MSSGYFGFATFGDPPRATDARWLTKVGLGERAADLGSSWGATSAEDVTFWGWHSSSTEAEALKSGSGHRLFFKGAIHNRGDLMRRLDKAPARGVKDASIVMAAYLQWGSAAFAELIGEFSLALWEPRERVVFLVRDVAGTQPLFYRRAGNRLLFATDIGVLLTDPAFHPEVEDNYIAGFLSGCMADTALTPYKGLHAVRPGAFLAASANGTWHQRTYWEIDGHQGVRYRSDRDYDEHFLTLFEDAVRQRLRSRHPILAELSGGLDSSSVVCMADRVVDPAETPAGIETLSYVYDESPSCDERPFIRAVEEGRGQVGHHLKDSEYRFHFVFGGSLVELSHPECCAGGFETGWEDVVIRTGAHRVLSGKGGDEVAGGTTLPRSVVADLLIRGQPLRFHRELRRWARLYGQPYVKVLASAVRAAFPGPALGRGTSGAPSWWHPEFVKRTQRCEKDFLPPSITRIKLPSSRAHAAAVWSAVVKLASESQYRRSRADYSYPFLHRPLVEFMLAIPPEQELVPGQNRVLMRRALNGILPDIIAERKGKAFGNEDFHRCLARQWRSIRALFEDRRFLSQEYIDPEVFLPVLDRGRHGLDLRIGGMLKVVMLEAWLRNLSGYMPEGYRAAASWPESHRFQNPSVGDTPVSAPC